ncbi:MAG: MdtA/MuxA family multidrug efflux RND transporter periplasmic adaptor subunit [Oxalobacter sp.]|nr:MdtA/MuxA family multidrug efflux RND transporter periplasmic adaptor subunit [Oxalobacter sp.]
MFKNAKFKRLSIIAVCALVAIAIIWAIYWAMTRNKGGYPRGGPIAVKVATAVQADAPLEITALGTVNSTYSVTVHSRVDGQLMRLHFTEGQFVRQGQLLAELDDRPFKAQLLQAEGQLIRDKALLENARLDLQRYRQLLSQNSIARQQVDTQAALVRQYEGSVKIDQGAVDNARLQITYSRITAPVTGRVGLRKVDLGNIVHASDAEGIVTITQEQPINVVFSIPEVDLSKVLEAYSADNRLAVEAWDRDDKNLLSQGVILALDNQLNTETGTIGIKAKFENTDRKLYPNQFVNVHMHLGAVQNAVLVPTAAVQLGKQGHTVYKVNGDGKVSLVKVRIGAVSGENTIIESGLEAGDTVVTDGVDKLRDGSQVKVVEQMEQPETPSGKPDEQTVGKAKPAP